MSSFYAIPGPAGTIQVGTVTTGAAGSSVSVTNSGTPEAATLNFTIPRGDTGSVSGVGPGSAASPAIYISGDTNTGLYSGGADILAFSTGGVGRLLLDASGRILAGATSSIDLNATWQVRNDSGNNTQLLRSSADTSGPCLNLTKSRGTAASPTEVSSGDELGIIRFRGYDGAAWQTAAQIQGYANGTWTDGGDTSDNPGSLIISVTTDGESTPTGRVKVDNTTQTLNEIYGSTYYPVVTQVDVGTGSNQIPLNSYLGTMAFQDASAFTGSIGLGSAAYPSLSVTGDENTGLYSPGADQLAISTGGTEQLRIDASGNLLSGTTSALGYGGRVLNLKSGQGYAGIASLTTESRIFSTWDTTAIPMTFFMGGSERMRLTSDGKLGLGTSSPDALLTVNGVGAFGAGSAAAPSFAITGDLNTGIYSPGADQLAISTGGTQRATVDSSGRLLVGTSSGSILRYGSNIAKIETNSVDFHLAMRSDLNANGHPFATFVKTRANAIVQNGDALGAFEWRAHDGTDVESVAASIEAYVDGTPGTNSMPGRIVLSTTPSGSATPVERLRITNDGYLRLAGAGIQFNGDTADANSLDDYEEGTFTATLKGGTTDPTTPVTTTGYYTKIGNLVNVVIQFSNVTTTGAAGEAYATGLPFTSSASSSEVGSVMCYQFDFNGLTSVSCYVGAGTTNLFPYMSGNNSAWNGVLHNAGTGRYLWMSVTYRAA